MAEPALVRVPVRYFDFGARPVPTLTRPRSVPVSSRSGDQPASQGSTKSSVLSSPGLPGLPFFFPLPSTNSTRASFVAQRALSLFFSRSCAVARCFPFGNHNLTTATATHSFRLGRIQLRLPHGPGFPSSRSRRYRRTLIIARQSSIPHVASLLFTSQTSRIIAKVPLWLAKPDFNYS